MIAGGYDNQLTGQLGSFLAGGNHDTAAAPNFVGGGNRFEGFSLSDYVEVGSTFFSP
jgi:hypothetical protein